MKFGWVVFFFVHHIFFFLCVFLLLLFSVCFIFHLLLIYLLAKISKTDKLQNFYRIRPNTLAHSRTHKLLILYMSTTFSIFFFFFFFSAFERTWEKKNCVRWTNHKPFGSYIKPRSVYMYVNTYPIRRQWWM